MDKFTALDDTTVNQESLTESAETHSFWPGCQHHTTTNSTGQDTVQGTRKGSANVEVLHVKESGGSSHVVISILMKNGNQVHSQHMDKGRRSNQLLEAQSLQIKHALIM